MTRPGRFLTFAALLLAFLNGTAMAENNNPLVEKQFVILRSTTDYKEARRTALKASQLLGTALDLRGLSEDKRIGLTFDERICVEEGGADYPCYVARGRYDDGDYVSIEYSSAFEGFAKGYYIVVSSSYTRGSMEISEALRKAKRYFKNAYSKTSNVYVGCIH